MRLVPRRSRRLLLAALAATAITAVAAGPAQAFACRARDFSFKPLATYKSVSAELGHPGLGTGMLRARATTVGPWERFRMVCLGNGQFAIRSLANNLYVSVQRNYSGSQYGMLRARASSIGEWERFKFQDVSESSAGAQGYLLSMANRLWVSAELGYTGSGYGMLRARAPVKGPWEVFLIVWR